jgi:hypothetical protein
LVKDRPAESEGRGAAEEGASARKSVTVLG